MARHYTKVRSTAGASSTGAAYQVRWDLRNTGISAISGRKYKVSWLYPGRMSSCQSVSVQAASYCNYNARLDNRYMAYGTLITFSLCPYPRVPTFAQFRETLNKNEAHCNKILVELEQFCSCCCCCCGCWLFLSSTGEQMG